MTATPSGSVLLAALPLGVILALMIGFRWSAARAGFAGLLLTLALVRIPFGYGDAVYPALGYGGAVGGAAAEAAFTAVTILWILFPALCIHHLQVITGRIDAIRSSVAGISGDPRAGLLLVVWFFTLFMEGAAGFGTPVALGAPLLVGIGVRPLHAVTASLIAHSVGVSFGAIGTPIAAQAAATGLDPRDLARTTAAFHAPIGWIMLLLAAHVLRGSVPGGRRGVIWTLSAAVLFLAPMYAIARWVGPELPTLGGALVGAVLFVVLVRSRSGSRAGRAPLHLAPLLAAAAPYLALIAIVLLTRLVTPLRDAALSWRIDWQLFGAFGGGMSPLYHPGTMLFVGFVAGAALQRASPADVLAAAGRAALQLRAVTVALLAMLGISRLMVHSGMIDTLAQAGTAAGAWWPLAAPFVGVLGTFVTGSATASNILMTDLQRATAAGLDLPVLVLLGAQGFGAAVGNIVAPHNIIAGCATVALTGREGDVLRTTVLACLLYATLGGLFALALVRILQS